jgi:hypothetical protein
MSDNEQQAPKYRINRNLKHNGVEFTPNQIVAGFDAATAAQLEETGTITKLVDGETVTPVDLKKDQAKVVSPAQQQATAAGIQPAQIVQQGDQVPTQPPVAPPLGGNDSAPQDGLTDEERAVQDTADQVD